ncbi:hypothetical protein WA026_016269 [Henosepilachna vigintioctopunctata]|uniref:Uncharacterized protein n=1 Tax=Henosepilachna vigintioctopunctata TaxID=420089 RepID=A0AAW1UFD4_9CUCU
MSVHNDRTERKRGRSTCENTKSFINYLINYIVDNETECQFSVNEIKEGFSGDLRDYTTIKNKLKEHFQNDIDCHLIQRDMIILYKNSTASKKLCKDWYEKRLKSKEDERSRIVQMADEIVLEDICRSEHLESFLNSADRFYERYGRTQDNSLSEFVYASICSKIIDDAGNFILCRPDLQTWPEVKQTLKEKFGDKIDRHVLQQQFIFITRNKTENISNFIERLELTKMRLNLKINSDPHIDPQTKLSLIQQNEVTAITVLISNSNDELRTLLMLKNPKDIDEATSLVLNHSLMEQQINFRYQPWDRNANKFQPRPINHQRQNNFNSYRNQSFNNRTREWMSHFQNSNIPTYFNNQDQQSPIDFEHRSVQHNYPTNEQVFGKQRNVFAPNNSYKPSFKATPMSTTSRMPSARSNNVQNNHRKSYFAKTGPANFISEEYSGIAAWIVN